MYTRRIFTGIKSLLHFDFPHFNAKDSRLKDETGLETWRLYNELCKRKIHRR